jgi:predicted nuclease of predicted toxin-antitoxin system
MIWLDAHLSPRIATWIDESLGKPAKALRDLDLRHAEDDVIFQRGHEDEIILITKDKDFAEMVMRKGSPPQVIWLRCGNTSEERLKQILESHLDEALQFLASGENLVEIR